MSDIVTTLAGRDHDWFVFRDAPFIGRLEAPPLASPPDDFTLQQRRTHGLLWFYKTPDDAEPGSLEIVPSTWAAVGPEDVLEVPCPYTGYAPDSDEHHFAMATGRDIIIGLVSDLPVKERIGPNSWTLDDTHQAREVDPDAIEALVAEGVFETWQTVRAVSREAAIDRLWAAQAQMMARVSDFPAWRDPVAADLFLWPEA